MSVDINVLQKKQLLKKAIEEAKKSSHRYRIGAVVFKKKYIISCGHNSSLKSVKHLHPKFYKWPGSIHAEIDAIIKAKADLKGCSLLVVRINKKDQLMVAKPCRYCMVYLSYVGIKKIYYSTKDGIKYMKGKIK